MEEYAPKNHKHKEYAEDDHGHPFRTFMTIVLLWMCFSLGDDSAAQKKQIIQLQQQVKILQKEISTVKHN